MAWFAQHDSYIADDQDFYENKISKLPSSCSCQLVLHEDITHPLKVVSIDYVMSCVAVVSMQVELDIISGMN